MTRELKRVSVLILAMFVALFASSTIIQSVQADSLREDGRNTRALLASFSVERGAILVEGTPIAESVPSNDQYMWQRQYPYGELYAAITGYNTLNQGNTGIEGAMNSELTGTANSQFFQQFEAMITGQDPQGSTVELTIDAEAQQAAVAALGDQEGAAVALDPETGDILALASSPSFDPNQLAMHDTQQVQDNYAVLNDDESDPLYNRAIAGDLYFPGSVFKLVVAAAALESGDYTLNSKFDNPSTLTLPGTETQIRNASRSTCGPGDETTIATAIILSCNIPFAELGQELGWDAISKQAQAMGYGQALNIPMTVTPSEYPAVENDAQLMLSAFGQQDVRVTPLQVAMTTAAISNGGTLMQPNLIDQVIAPDLSVISDPEPVEQSDALSDDVAQDLHDVMIRGVQEGLASNAAIDGVTVGGKTGTAENGEDDEPYNLWFTGFGETDEQSVAVAVVVVPDANVAANTSNVVAAPIGRKIIEAVLNQ